MIKLQIKILLQESLRSTVSNFGFLMSEEGMQVMPRSSLILLSTQMNWNAKSQETHIKSVFSARFREKAPTCRLIF